jgi:hypothetical protein
MSASVRAESWWLRPKERLRGRVVDADQGRTVPGVTVRVMAVDGWPRQSRGVAVSGAGGAFEVTGLSAGQYRAAVQDGAWYGESDWVADVSPGSPGESLEVLVRRAHQLTGRVVIAGSGEPCPNARVVASLAGSRGRTTFADDAGRAILHGLSPGEYTIVASCDGLVSPAPLPVEVVGVTDEPDEAIWYVAEGAVLRVEVFDEAARPVSASVWIETTRGRRVTIEEALDGRADVVGLQPGSYVVWARNEEGIASEDVVVRAPRDEPVQVVMPSTGRIEGTVVDHHDRPVRNAVVMCRGVMSCASIPGTRRFRTDDRGRFVLAAPSGAVDLVVSPPFLHPFSESHPAVVHATVDVPSGGVAPTTISLGRLDAILAGVVLDGEEPVGNAVVTPWRGDVPLGYLRDLFEEDASVVTDGRGRFVIGPLVAGPYRVEVKTEAGKAAEVETHAPDADLVIRLSPPGWVSGTVRHEDGTVPESFSVLAVSAAGQFRVPQQYRGTGGLFSVEALAPGEWRFRVVAGEMRGLAEATVGAGRMARAEIVLAPAATVTGRVVEAGTQRPVAGARAVLGSETVPLLVPFRATSGPNGELAFPLVDPGTYALTVSSGAEGAHSDSRRLEVGSAPLELGDLLIRVD